MSGKKEIYYRQCRLEKKTDRGVCCQTSWLPEQYAVKGKYLKLKDDNGEWINGWLVVEASSSSRAEHLLPDYHTEIKSHRRATGDALPKNPQKATAK